MKKILLAFVGMSLVFSCSTEEKQDSYTTAIRNTSNKSLHILILGNEENRNTPVHDTLVNIILNPGEITFKNTYVTSGFSGFHNGTYSIDIYYSKISFLNNNKGYICDENSTSNVLCFQNKISLNKAYYKQDFNLENEVYYYDITQEDYENAHVLPE